MKQLITTALIFMSSHAIALLPGDLPPCPYKRCNVNERIQQKRCDEKFQAIESQYYDIDPNAEVTALEICAEQRFTSFEIMNLCSQAKAYGCLR